MKFKEPHLAEEWERLHPETKAALEELEDWSRENRIPEPVLTCISRTVAQNKLAGGVANSWHLFDTAADIRLFHYSPAARASVLAFLRRQCPREEFELLVHDAGSGEHLHLARKDEAWKLTFPQRKESPHV